MVALVLQAAPALGEQVGALDQGVLSMRFEPGRNIIKSNGQRASNSPLWK